MGWPSASNILPACKLRSSARYLWRFWRWDALGFAGGDFVADALGGHFAFELRERKQDVEGEPPHGGGGVELLGDGDEGDVVGIEDFHHFCEVGQRARETVDFVDDDGVDFACFDVLKQLL